MASNKKYWKSVEELKKSSSIVEKLKQNEFVEEIPTDQFLGDKENLTASSTSRRDFLKYLGFSTAVASLAACEGPVIKSIPYVVKPDDVTPGMADFYATTMADGFDFANILVKVREGRPIKIEPNKDIATGITNARVQASVLSLYDENRLKRPKANGKDTTWKKFDAEVVSKLNEIKNAGGKLVFLTNTCASPSIGKLIKTYGEEFGNVEHVVYDAVSESAALDAMKEMYGVRALPDYDFSKADMIVSIGADFLGDWQGGGFAPGYAKGRVPKNGKMSYHVQIESNMSLTGGNADKRIMVKPSGQIKALLKLYKAVVNGISTRENSELNTLAGQIVKAGKKAVVVTGIQDKNAQLLALAINKKLQSEALDTVNTRNVRHGDDAKVKQLITDMNAGKVSALFMSNVNPVYTLPASADFAEGLKKVKLSVDFAISNDETAQLSQYVAAIPHYLESWGDVMIKKGQFSLIQPTIKPLFDTRQFQCSLLKWLGKKESFYDFLKSNWNNNILAGKSWNKALHDGVFTKEFEVPEFTSTVDVNAAAKELASIKGAKRELTVYTTAGMGDGQQANNPWLQELPDPITRTSWDNYLLISRIDAEKLGLKNWTVDNGALNGDLVNISANGVNLKKIPVYIQPGQAPGSYALALGYGRTDLQKEMNVGVNAYPFSGKFFHDLGVVKSPGEHEFACVQLQHTIMGREGDITRETTLAEYISKPKEEWNPEPKYSLEHQEVTEDKVDLWRKFDDSIGTKFNMSIDLATCTGCAACVVACHAENNVPVVGKHEIRVSRDMHWLRIDRYYSSDMSIEKGKEEGTFGTGEYFDEMTHPSDAPEVSFQPVMCQHCNHAPCETVCPVAATSHGRQGQNMMAYNRCIGTRYCANNCPYKVRRFNWFKYFNNDEFDYNMNNDLGRMVLNPDVVVRSRGVMEKCSLCIQKTQATILKAKKEGRPVRDGEFETACSSACPSNAIVFGDINDKSTEISKKEEDDRTFRLLEFVGTKPNVFYHLKVKNKKEA
ncbi:MAG: quinol:cytochrome C oxidoreductase [Flavobacteriia bacterium]|nr:MAG: quinol:cytochrome C oxidoreductase [Flavobacteriia bacterium]